MADSLRRSRAALPGWARRRHSLARGAIPCKPAAFVCRKLKKPFSVQDLQDSISLHFSNLRGAPDKSGGSPCFNVLAWGNHGAAPSIGQESWKRKSLPVNTLVWPLFSTKQSRQNGRILPLFWNAAP